MQSRDKFCGKKCIYGVVKIDMAEKKIKWETQERFWRVFNRTLGVFTHAIVSIRKV